MDAYKDEIKSLKKTHADKIDWLPKLRKESDSRGALLHPNLAYSQLGANYGPMTRA